jgi:TnpA family transposase
LICAKNVKSTSTESMTKKNDSTKKQEAIVAVGRSRREIYILRQITDSYNHKEKREMLNILLTDIYSLLDKVDFYLQR